MKPFTVTFADESEARALQRAYDFFYCTKVATDALDAQYGKGTAKAAEHACSTLAAAFAERANEQRRCPYCETAGVDDPQVTHCPHCARRIRRQAGDGVGTYADEPRRVATFNQLRLARPEEVVVGARVYAVGGGSAGHPIPVFVRRREGTLFYWEAEDIHQRDGWGDVTLASSVWVDSETPGK